MPLLGLAQMGSVLVKLQWLAKQIPLEAPWQAKRARELDQQTFGDWIRANVSHPQAAGLTQTAFESVFAAHPDEVSLLHALFYMRSGNSFDFLTKAKGGAQQDRVVGGVQPLAEQLAKDIQKQSDLVLNAEVYRVEQTPNGVVVQSKQGEHMAKFLIVAIPPPLAHRIAFTPNLSDARQNLLSRLPMGSVIKCLAVYEKPFWREAGLSGSSIGYEPPIKVTFDASPRSGKPGVLLTFLEGPEARLLAESSQVERRAIVLERFIELFGTQAGTPLNYTDRVWANETFSQGCYSALFPPGVWSTVGQTIRAPEGRIHWAGG